MPSESAAWTLSGIAPRDNTFRDAGEEVHRAYWRFIAAKGVERFRWRCNAGLDRNGAGLTGIAPSTRAKGRWRSHTGEGSAANPPLSPALGRSRTEDLIRGRGFADHAEWYWATDSVTGMHWGQVMVWHREGSGNLPQRDVIGWSKADIAWLQAEGQQWWYAYQHGLRVAEAAKRLELPAATMERLHKAHEVPPPPHYEPEAPRPTPTALPPKIKVTGRLDIEHMTPGPLADKERTVKAIAEGYHSGFSRVTKGGPTIFRTSGAPPGPAPAPAPPKAPAPTPAAAAARARPARVASRVPAAVATKPARPKPAAKPKPSPKPAPQKIPVVKPNLPEHRQHVRYVESEHARVIGEMARQVGMTPEQYRGAMQKQLQSAVDAGEFYIRADTGKLPTILNEGRFKSQFETNSSHGALSPGYRATVEAISMGVPKTTRPTERPIYGYVAAPNFATAHTHQEAMVAQYGDAVIRLKPDARQKATITAGDSLTQVDNLFASPATDVSEGSLPFASPRFRTPAWELLGKPPDRTLELVQVHMSYLEAQYQGGVSTGDIADVAFKYEPPVEVQEALNQRGIPWRVLRP